MKSTLNSFKGLFLTFFHCFFLLCSLFPLEAHWNVLKKSRNHPACHCVTRGGWKGSGSKFVMIIQKPLNSADNHLRNIKYFSSSLLLTEIIPFDPHHLRRNHLPEYKVYLPALFHQNITPKCIIYNPDDITTISLYQLPLVYPFSPTKTRLV